MLNKVTFLPDCYIGNRRARYIGNRDRYTSNKINVLFYYNSNLDKLNKKKSSQVTFCLDGEHPGKKTEVDAAKLAEQAERYDDMVHKMKAVAEMKIPLSSEVRLPLFNTFANILF